MADTMSCPKCNGANSNCSVCKGRGTVSTHVYASFYGELVDENTPQGQPDDNTLLRSVPVDRPRKAKERSYTTGAKKRPTALELAFQKSKGVCDERTQTKKPTPTEGLRQ